MKDFADENPEKIIYWLDSKKRIEAIDGPWDEFALENDGANLSVQNVEGHNILNFVAGDVTKMWFDTLLQLASMRDEPIVRPYRCDSPNVKRFMQMRVVRENQNLIRLEHVLLQTEPQEFPIRFSYPYLISKKDGHKIMYQRCSQCGRIYQGADWHEPDSLQTIIARQPADIVVAYTICQDCTYMLPFT